jgi:hypothetical protein
MCVCVWVCVRVYVCARVCVCVCVYVCVCACVQTINPGVAGWTLPATSAFSVFVVSLTGVCDNALCVWCCGFHTLGHNILLQYMGLFRLATYF